METQIQFLQWLWKKLYQVTLGFYLTIALIMLVPPALIAITPLPSRLVGFLVFFVIVFLRAGYETLVIYEAPFTTLSPQKMSLLSATSAGITMLIAHFVKPSLGYFSIPVSVVISMLLVNRLKAKLWPATHRPGFFALLPDKLNAASTGRYLFFGILVGIAYTAYGKLGYNFYLAFTAAFFVGMIAEELYNLLRLYEAKLTIKLMCMIAAWSILCAIITTVIVWFMMSMIGYSGQVATITSVMIVKLIQPLCERSITEKL